MAWQLSRTSPAQLGVTFSAGQITHWLTATNGAAKINWKAKTLDGTVVTRQDALT